MKLSAIHTLLFPILVSSLTTPVSRTERNVEGVTLAKRATCTPASAGNEAVDDVPAIKAAFQSCGNGGTIVIPADKTYSIRSILDFAGCVGCTFTIEGTLKASNDLTYWNGKRSIFFMTGVKTATIQSLTGKSVLDGNGQATYDKYAADKNYKRPTLHYITGACSNIKIKNLIVKNAPAWIFSVNSASTNVEYSDLTITTGSTSNNPAKNTDGFDVGESTYTTLKNIKVSNQDDCVAFKPGANFVTVDTITCTGSHGISVGSLGKTAGTKDTINNVYVRKANMIDATKAIGIKVYPGGSAHGTVVVSNITWDDVTCTNCGYAAQIESCYAACRE